MLVVLFAAGARCTPPGLVAAWVKSRHPPQTRPISLDRAKDDG